MVKNKTRQPAEWIAQAAAAFGWLRSALVWSSGDLEQRVVSTVSMVMVVIATITVAAITVTRRSSALGVLALATLFSPLLILFTSFASR